MTCSLQAQLQEIDHAIGVMRTHRLAGMRPAERELHVTRLMAVRDTLAWLQAHEVELRAFMALAPERRAALLGGAP